MKRYKILYLFPILFWQLSLHANILLQKPQSFSEEQLQTLIEKWHVDFTWNFNKKRTCTFSYEKGNAGFAFKFLSIPFYCKNYRVLPSIDEVKHYFYGRAYNFTKPLEYAESNPTQINAEELYSFIKNKKCVFYTGAGLSASGNVPMMNELMESLYLNAGSWHFLKNAWNNSQQIQDAFADFCKSAIYENPTQAHLTLKNIAQEKSVAIITENFDLLHHRTGIEPLHACHETLPSISSEWQAVDAIICIGLSHDDRGLLAWYKLHNPHGILVAIDLKTPRYLSDTDFIYLGDIQEILSTNTANQYLGY